MDSKLRPLVKQLAILALEQNSTCAAAESCTGGMIASSMTDLAGSSAWFDRGFVTYSNQAKVDMLSVQASILDLYGAVSDETVREMAVGAIEHSLADISVSVSGIAGPDGGSAQKPVGTVCFAWARKKHYTHDEYQVLSQSCLFHGDRAAIRILATEYALQGLIALLSDQLEEFTRG